MYIYIYISLRFTVKNSVTSYLAFILNLSNLRMTILQARNWFKVVRYGDSYAVFLGRWILAHGLVVTSKASHSK